MQPPKPQTIDERFYAQVAAELAHTDPSPGLWAKSFAEANGDEARAKALYLRLRAEQLWLAERGAKRASRQRQGLNLHALFWLGLLVVVVVAAALAIVTWL